MIYEFFQNYLQWPFQNILDKILSSNIDFGKKKKRTTEFALNFLSWLKKFTINDIKKSYVKVEYVDDQMDKAQIDLRCSPTFSRYFGNC